jgi:CubicO group peptidase (beta-lactamase class C family)
MVHGMLLHLASLVLALVPIQETTEQVAAPAPVPEVRDLSKVLDPIREARKIPAMAAVLLTSEGIVAEGYSGVHGVGSEQQVVAENLFHLGSCSKAMTATLAATFVEEELLTWESTLGEVFPELEESMHETWKEVTVAQLMSHTAGAPGDLRDFLDLNSRLSEEFSSLAALRLEVLQALTASAPAYAPGSEDLYSNWGYCLLGAMLERIGGAPWEDLMQQRVFGPLGMESGGFGPPNGEADSGQPFGHTEDGEARVGKDNHAVIGPAGTVHATLRDWAKFVRMHLRGAQGEGDLLLTSESYVALHTPRPGTEDAYAAGWLIMKRGWSKGKVMTHSGSNTLWFCTVWIAPNEDFAVLVATNRGGSPGSKATDAACWRLILDQIAARKAEEG